MPNCLDSFLFLSVKERFVQHLWMRFLTIYHLYSCSFNRWKKFPICLHRGKQQDCFSVYRQPSRLGQIPPARTYSALDVRHHWCDLLLSPGLRTIFLKKNLFVFSNKKKKKEKFHNSPRMFTSFEASCWLHKELSFWFWFTVNSLAQQTDWAAIRLLTHSFLGDRKNVALWQLTLVSTPSPVLPLCTCTLRQIFKAGVNTWHWESSHLAVRRCGPWICRHEKRYGQRCNSRHGWLWLS